jgi:ATP/maltotriose-dependent transcriptional regulator MalT/DNA-binding SARP family transcriptional activator
MLADTSLTGPTRDAVIEVFLRELHGIAPHGAVLIFDDFHLVDESPDVQLVVREIIARGPERLAIVFSSRRTPGVPLARLRSTGEVSELTTDDLRFDRNETQQLFRDSYHRPLEPDVIEDVTARTEGWAASLHLVNAALRDRSPGEIRGFVRNLSGGDHELYDYLAEEVIGDLPTELRTFLMQTSVLQVVTPEFAGVVTSGSVTDTARLTSVAERLTLLSRRARGPRNELRYHPLVREFLQARLTRDVGSSGVAELHRLVADYAKDRDWRISAYHLWSAGDNARLLDVIDVSAKGIIGRGEYLVATGFLSALSIAANRAHFEVVLSRRDSNNGDVRSALDRAEHAVLLDPTSDLAMANLASQHFNAGDLDTGTDWAQRLLGQSEDSSIQGIAAGILTISSSSLDGDVSSAIAEFANLAKQQHQAGYAHFEGISHLNLADAYRASGDVPAARREAVAAIDLLASSSAGSEVPIARAILGWANAHLEQLDEAREELDSALAAASEASRPDVLLEGADFEVAYGSDVAALDHLTALEASGGGAVAGQVASIEVLVALRHANVDEARRISDTIDENRPSNLIGYKSRVLTLKAHALVAAQSAEAIVALDRAQEHARRQSANLWVEVCAALRALTSDASDLNRFIRSRSRNGLWPISRLAELVVDRLDDLPMAELGLIEREAIQRPERWRSALRLVLDRPAGDSVRAARLLEAVGDKSDIARLRRVARTHRGRPEADLGRALARTLAPRVYVEDLGRVSIRVGARTIEGASIRRKVLALLCFLMTRPRFAAARDEVMDALWPEFDPADALNSLNQTVYFLRRVFEPEYKDDLSPGYVHHESDVIWLDAELVRSHSQDCLELIRRIAADPAPTEVMLLAASYAAPFALDFSYEEWASAHRVSLHAAYLQVMEWAVADDTANGHFERGIDLARRALTVSPDADQIEVSLLRLYRLSGSHAAAAEQYEHYAAAMRETFGIDPPALESL